MTGIPGKEHKGGFPCPFGGKFKPRVGNVPCLSDIDCIQKVEKGFFFFFVFFSLQSCRFGVN